MFKFLLLLSLLPLSAGVIIKKLFQRPGRPLIGKKSQVSLLKLYKELSPNGLSVEAEGKHIKVQKGVVHLPVEIAESKELNDHLEPLFSLGLLLLGRGRDTALKQHASLTFFDTLFPSFCFITLLLGVIAKSIALPLALLIGVLVLGVSALNNLYLTWLRSQALKALLPQLQALPLYTKNEDFPALLRHLKGNAYRYSVPKLIAWAI